MKIVPRHVLSAMIDWLRKQFRTTRLNAVRQESLPIHPLLRRGPNAVGPTEPLEIVLKRLNGNIDQRREAAYDLGYFSARDVLPVLSNLLDDPDEYVRVYTIQALVRRKDSAAVPLLVERAARPQPELVLTNVIRALAEFRDRRATPVLCELLSSKEPMVRYEAAFALGEIGDTNALPVLRQLTSDPTMPTSGDDVETIESVGQIAGKSIRKIESGRAVE